MKRTPVRPYASPKGMDGANAPYPLVGGGYAVFRNLDELVRHGT
jgi:hypothetical protein